MMVKERHQVVAITFKAWDFVCQTRDCKGLQIAPYLSRDMATRLKVDTLTEVPGKGTKKVSYDGAEIQSLFAHYLLRTGFISRDSTQYVQTQMYVYIFKNHLFSVSFQKGFKAVKEIYLQIHLLSNF